jgi:murein DD-endopeptidase MepM/ murein hydrolase activator NlpD
MRASHIVVIVLIAILVFEFVIFLPEDLSPDNTLYLSSTKVSSISKDVTGNDSLDVNENADSNDSSTSTLKNIHAPYVDADAKLASVTSSYYSAYHIAQGQPTHRAIDLAVNSTTAGIAAVWDGVVVANGCLNTDYGESCIIQHKIDGVTIYSRYNHMVIGSTSKYVKVGDTVKAGQQIGIQGGSASATQPNKYGIHLDLQMSIFDTDYDFNTFTSHLVNPAAIYKGWVNTLDDLSMFNYDTCIKKGTDYANTSKVDSVNGETWWK